MLDEAKIYIAILGEYNNGRLVGDWFDFPLDRDAISELLGNNEYIILDWEGTPSGFIDYEYESLDALDARYERLASIDDPNVSNYLGELADAFGLDYLDQLFVCAYIGDEYRSPEDAYFAYLQETGELDDVPEHLIDFIDYKKLLANAETDRLTVVNVPDGYLLAWL